jgi:hypothetical protein
MFIQRFPDGTVQGVYANKQSGYAEEELPDDNPEVIAFLAPKVETPTPTIVEQILASPADLAALKKALGL